MLPRMAAMGRRIMMITNNDTLLAAFVSTILPTAEKQPMA